MPVRNAFQSLSGWVARSSENKRLVVSMGFLTIYLALSIYVKIYGEQNLQYNVQLLGLINGGQSPALNYLLVTLSNYGREGFWIPVMILLWVFGGAGHKRSALGIAIASALAVATGELSKAILAQQRPFNYYSVSLLLSPPSDYSYPSGHAIVVASCAVFGVLTLSGYLSIPLLAEAILVSYSRIYTGVHWPIDVLGAWIIGISIAFLTPKIIEQISLAYGKTNPEHGKGTIENNKIDDETLMVHLPSIDVQPFLDIFLIPAKGYFLQVSKGLLMPCHLVTLRYSQMPLQPLQLVGRLDNLHKSLQRPWRA